MAETKNNPDDRIPVNITLFSPKILGMEARKAVLLMLVISTAGLISRFSISYAGAIIAAGVLFLFPVRNGTSPGGLLFKAVSWKISALFNLPAETGAKIADHNGIPVIVEGRKRGFCIEVSAGSHHTLSRNDRTDYLNTVSSAITSSRCNLTFIALPYTIAARDYYTETESEYGENYNLLMDYMLAGQYYYRSYVIVWDNIGRNLERTEENILDDAESLAASLSSLSVPCRVISRRERVSEILEALV